MFPAFIHRLNNFKQQIPFLNELHLNFIFLHYIYIISWAIIGSIILYPGGNISYTNALFQACGSATQSGLNTVDLNQLYLYQQIVLYMITNMCTPIFIHSGLVFIRLYWFEKRFQHVARDARAMRTTRSRMDTVTQDKEAPDVNRAELGVGGRSIVVLRNNAGDALGTRLPNPAIQTTEHQTDDESADGKKASEPSGSEDTEEPIVERRFGLGSLRVPTQLSPEHHIAFLENQRKNKGALRIPSPREYDRGGVPQALEEGEEEEERDATQQPSSPRSDRRRSSTDSENDQVGPLEGPRITINEPDFPRARTRGNTLSRLDTRPTIRDTMTRDVDDANALAPTTTRNTFRVSSDR